MNLWGKARQLRQALLKEGVRAIFVRVVLSHTSPHQIALGAAIGVFFSVIPTFSLGMFMTLLIAWKARLNLLAAYLGTLVVNPLNSPVVYFINYKIGSWLLRIGAPLHLPATLAEVGGIAKQVYLGGVVLGAAAAVLAYFLIYAITLRFRQARDLRRRTQRFQKRV